MSISRRELEKLGIDTEKYLVVEIMGKKQMGVQKVETCEVYRYDVCKGKLYKIVSADKTTPKNKKAPEDVEEEEVGVDICTFRSAKEYVESYHDNSKVEECSREDAFIAAL